MGNVEFKIEVERERVRGSANVKSNEDDIYWRWKMLWCIKTR